MGGWFHPRNAKTGSMRSFSLTEESGRRVSWPAFCADLGCEIRPGRTPPSEPLQLSAQSPRPPPHVPGEVVELHKPIMGGYNIHYRLEYKDGSSAALRIPCKGM